MTTRRSFLAEWRDAVRDSGLDSSTKLVGHTLSTYMDRTGYAYPAKTTLAKKASLSVRTVDGAIDKLEMSLLLRVSRPKNRRAGFTYRAVLPNRQPLPDEMALQPATNSSSSGNQQHAKPAAIADESSRKQKESANRLCIKCKSNKPIPDGVQCAPCIRAEPKRPVRQFAA
jgi:hypothetical protein